MAANELYHFGILGMKWGVRRFQNEDGTLTEEGKKRYLVYKSDNKGKNKAYAITSQAEKEFFKNGSSNLTREGRRVVENEKTDQDLKTLVKSVQFNRKYGENWIKSYNEASNIFNVKINDINNKYDDPSINEKTYRRYVKEVNDMWQKEYKDVLLKNFGEHPMDGDTWVEGAQGYGNYSDPDAFILPDMRRKWDKNKKNR